MIGFDLFEGFVCIDVVGQVVLGVVLLWECKMLQMWIFKFCYDVKWSNGQLVMVVDFVYLWQCFVDLKMGLKYMIFVEFIKNLKDIIVGKVVLLMFGVCVVDLYMFEVMIDVFVVFFFELIVMVLFVLVNKDVVVKFGDVWMCLGNIVSNGVYQFVDWQLNNCIVVMKDVKYWNVLKVVINKVMYLLIESDEIVMCMYQVGQIDYSYLILLGIFQQVSKQFGVELCLGL